MSNRAFAVLFILLWLSSCIDPYNPEVIGGKGLLVIDGMITDQAGPHRVYLSRTKSLNNPNHRIPDKVSGAQVEVTDDEGNVFLFEEIYDGIYASEPDVKGVVGRSYQIKISFEGKEYLSAPELLPPSAEPVSLSAEFAGEFLKDGSNNPQKNKVLFYVNLADTEGTSDFYKYSVDYTYEIEVPYWLTPYECGDTTKQEPTPRLCYANEKPATFLNTLSLKGHAGSQYNQHFLTEVEPNRRFMSKFSLHVVQYSMTERAYNFWEDIKAQSLKTGSLFDSPPGRILGNIESVSDPGEAVFGYFMASSVKEERAFFSPGILGAEFENFTSCDCFPEISAKCLSVLPQDTNNFELPAPHALCCDCRLYPNSSVEQPSFWTD